MYLSNASMTFTGSYATWLFSPQTLVAASTSANTFAYTWAGRCMRFGKRRGMKQQGAVYRLDDGSYFIRGTTDLEEVKRLLEEDEYVRDAAPEDEDWEVVLDSPTTALWRFVPCNPRNCGDHSWHLHHAKKPGRGVMKGVLTNAEPKAVTFGVDLLVPGEVPSAP